MTFRNCTLFNALQVGLVKPSSNSAEANDILDAIFNEVHDIYESTDGRGEFQPVVFNSYDEVDSRVKSHSYVDDMLCFVIGWNEFEPETHTFDLEIGYNYMWLPPSRLP